ncbi:MAG: hypothetical protein WB952_26485 [Terriglobales bacterium]
MKLGTENRKQIIVLVVLGGLALLLIGRIILGVGAPTPTATAPVPLDATPVRPRPVARGRVKGNRIVAAAPRSIDPSLRYDWLKASEDTQYEGNGRNIFMLQAEIPEPVKNPALDQEKAATGPPLPPPPPPITLKFYGFASKAGEPKRVFLSQGEDLFIASEGEIVDRRYKVLHITPLSVEIEDVLNNNRQSIPLTQG